MSAAAATVSAPDMIEDPHWLPGTAPDVDNHHVLASPYAASLPRPTPRLGGSAALLLPVLLPVLMIRRRRPRPRL